MELVTGEYGNPILVLPVSPNDDMMIVATGIEKQHVHNLPEEKVILNGYVWTTKPRTPEAERRLIQGLTYHNMRVIGIDYVSDKYSVYTVSILMLEGRGPGLILLPFDSNLDEGVVPTLIRSGNDAYIITDD